MVFSERKQMIIFQVGVCKGNDDVTKIVQKNPPELLVLVEPNAFHNEDILDCYSEIENVHVENIAITDDPRAELAAFYHHKDDGPLYEVSALDPRHILKHGYHPDGIVESTIQAMTIGQVFDKHDCKKIDILSIDAEGFDDRIIRSIDLAKYDIKNIYFENLHLQSNLNAYLYNMGYNITQGVGKNGWSNLAVKQ